MTTPTLYSKAFNIVRGDTFIKTLHILDTSSDPIDLTLYGDEWSAQLRSTEDNANFIPFRVITDQLASGTIVLRLDSDVTAELPSKGLWDLQVADTNQNPPFVRTLVRGTFVRIKDVTRP